MARAVIIGASIGGLPAAYEARALLDKKHKVTVISNVDSFHFVPSNPWVAVGWRKRKDISFRLRRVLEKRGIEFVHAAADQIEPEKNPVLKLLRKFTPVSSEYDGDRFFVIRDGKRWSAARGFLKPALKRPNLRLETGCLVENIVFDGKRAAGVSFRQSGQRRVARCSGEVILSAGAVATPALLERSGIGDGERLRALGVGSLKRNPVLPEVPAIADSVAGYETVNWFGVLAPAATPLAVIDRLHREVSAVQNAPELQKQFDADGATVLRMTPAAFGAYMIEDMNKWERVVKDGGIKAQ